MKNTLENKAKFFAQYWGQKVGREGTSVENDGFERNYIINHFTIQNIDYDYLELKSLSQINDEDIIKVAELRGFVNIKSIKNDYNGFWVKFLGNEHTKWVFFNELYQPEIDYLRSKGYALDWNGITVEEQVEFGWVKLTN